MPVARSTAYATTKHAVVGLSTSLREEGRPHGIRVSVAIPGLVDTRIFSAATNVGGHDYAAAIGKMPIGKISPQQAACAILAGVTHNRQYIVFPAYNRLIVGLSRMFPGFMGWLINRAT
jgi:short-subunit dehydrogenase